MSLKEDISKALVDSVKDSFKTMLSVDLVESDLSPGQAPEADLICTIGLAGLLEGSISVLLSEAAASTIVSQMLGMDIPSGSPDVNDGACEVVNVIAGGVKMRAAALACRFEISIPTVVRGKLMHINITNDVEKVVRRFSTDKFCFDIEFIFKMNKESATGSGSPVASSKLSAIEKLKALTAKAKSQSGA